MAKYPTREAVQDLARGERGTTESPAESNRQKYGAAYGWNGVPWCGIFIWWLFAHLGLDLRKVGISNPAYTPTFAAEAAKHGWVAVGRASIQRGDVLFLDVPNKTTGIEHVELATGPVVRGAVTTIGGNTSGSGSQDNGGAVVAKSRPVGWVVRALRPPYAAPTPSVAQKVKAAVLAKPAKPTVVLREGSAYTLAVCALQTMLNRKLGGADLKVDGKFGPATRAHVIAYQRAHRLTADGIAGPVTIASLWS